MLLHLWYACAEPHAWLKKNSKVGTGGANVQAGRQAGRQAAAPVSQPLTSMWARMTVVVEQTAHANTEQTALLIEAAAEGEA